MALTSKIHRCELQISDLDRNYYETHALTIARHPSETDERMMVRLLAFALHAADGLAFAGDISDSEEPALWRRDLTGAVIDWIEVGQPDVKVVRRAAGRARNLFIYAYGRAAAPWWSRAGADFARFGNLQVASIDAGTTQALAALAMRNMQLNCVVQDGACALSDPHNSVAVQIELLKRGAAPR